MSGPTPRAPEDMAFVSVVSWPRGWGPAEILRAIVASTGLDPVDAQQVAARKPPLIVAPMSLAAAKDAVRVLREGKVPALAVKRADMDRLRPAFLAKRLVPGADNRTYVAEPWRPRLESPRALDLSEVVLLVRGRVAQSTRVTTVETQIEPGSYGSVLDAEISSTRVTTSRGTVQEILDLYTREGPPVRVSGKFDFTTVLGKERALTDRENMDRLAIRLGEQAPGATIDLNFGEFRRPGAAMAQGNGPGTRPSRPTGPGGAKEIVTARDDMPAFDFYSAWVAMLDAAVRRGREQAGREG